MESDYFRNRLTHSLEVGQIAKSIAIRLNALELPAGQKLDPDLVELAGWCHDVGHPPFGHQGEIALDRLMCDTGGFEGNAQALRILSRLEKRDHSCQHESGIDDEGRDCRLGLNLSARSLAAVLKYDNQIPHKRKAGDDVVKGYYGTESEVVKWIKRQVVGSVSPDKFKTVECQIMDLADDIAYSTYDLEDTFKAGFFGPLDMLSSEAHFEEVARKTADAIGEGFTKEDVSDLLVDLFSEVADGAPTSLRGRKRLLALATVVHAAANRLARNGYLRSQFTSKLVRLALEGVTLTLNAECPVLSTVSLGGDAHRRVEVLKHFTFEATIKSPRVKVSQFRANEIIKTIFEALEQDDRLLPDDCREVYERIEGPQKKRVLCDFTAGMTDRYALEFYGRIKSENPQTIFKPL